MHEESGEEVKHTFLFNEARWRAEATYLTEDGETLPARGSSAVFHREYLWVVDGGRRGGGR